MNVSENHAHANVVDMMHPPSRDICHVAMCLIDDLARLGFLCNLDDP